MDNNTLLGRCTQAYLEGASPRCRLLVSRDGVAAVLEHLAAELVVMNQRNERLTVHEVARIFTLEAAVKE